MIRILFAVAMLAAGFGSAQAKPTFNEVRAVCRADIKEFLGDTPWAGHAYRVDLFNAYDHGTHLIRVFSGKGFDLDFEFVPYHHAYALVGIRRLEYVHSVSRHLLVDPVETFTDHELREERERFQALFFFGSRRAEDAPIWFVFRQSTPADGPVETMLFTVRQGGECAYAAYFPSNYPFQAKNSPGQTVSR